MFRLINIHNLALSAFLWLCMSLLPGRAEASHAAGAELIYEWVSGSTYQFYLKFYRDCGGISEPNTIRLCYFNSCSNQTGQVTMSQLTQLPDGTGNGKEVLLGCPGYPTECDSGSLPGFREIWYGAVITLPSQCDYWTFYTSIVARNPNHNVAGSVALYVEATLNNQYVQQQSSPWFSNPPVPYVCINSPYTLNNGAVDPDNDSLSFEFIYPRSITGSNCVGYYNATNLAFRAGYSLTEPFATGNTFQFDQLSGQMSFTPVMISANTVAMRVSKWRNGVRLGTVMRDIQIQVLGCNIPPPTFDTVSGSFYGSVVVNGMVEGSVNQPVSFCYDIATTAVDGVLAVSDNHAIIAPGSSTNYNGIGTASVLGCFNWTPSCADTGLKIFTVAVKDSTCKPPGVAITQTFSLPIYIRSGTVINTRKVTCAGVPVTLKSTGTGSVTWSALPGGSPVSSLSCTNCATPDARPEVTTVYDGVSDIGGCRHTDRITVVVDNDANEFVISPVSPHIMCDPDTLHLEVDILGPKPVTNLMCGLEAQLPATKNDTVEAVPPTAIVIQNITNPGSTPFGGGFATTSRHQYLLRASDLRASGMYSGTLKSLAFHISSTGSGALYDSITISLGCTDQQALDPGAGFLLGTEQVYTATGPRAMLARGGWVHFDFDTYYNWDTTQNLIVDICYANADTVTSVFTHFFNNNYQSTLYSFATSGSACGQAGLTVYNTHELPLMRIGYHHAPEYTFPYKWGGSTFFPDDTSRTTSTYIHKVTHLTVSSVSRHGCVIADTLSVYFAEPFAVIADTSVCYGSSVQLFADSGSEFRWYENGFNPATSLSCDDCATPVASPLEDVTYTVTGLNIYGCPDTVQVFVRVKPLPETKIISENHVVRYGESILLQASGAERYTWIPIRGLSAPNSNITEATPEETKEYVVIGEKEGCYANDTIRLVVDFTSRAFIPSAFSPNGDGKNDVFRIGNIDFEKVQEFRVFNRWGKEIFSTSDPKEGWDGTWNGVPQDGGVYNYMIRLAYPDGNARLFTGTVTLMR